MHKNLQSVYLDPSHASSFYGLNKIIHTLKSSGHKIPPRRVVEWLEAQDAYTLHKYRRLHYPRRNYNVYNIDDVWESDLIDLRSIKSYNDGYSYILVVIDVLSKYAYGEILKNKSCETVTHAFKRILQRSKPRKAIVLQTDKGREYLGNSFQNLLKENDIKFRVPRSPEIKASIAERFNRNLKERLFKFFTASNTKRYVDVIQPIIESYNKTYHSSIKMAPCQVDMQNAYLARKNLEDRYAHHFTNKKPKYNVGDLVRVSTVKNVFEKTYEGTFTEEIFKIIRISKTRAPFVYFLQDLNGEEVDGIFYEQELTRVRKDIDKDTFIIEKILRSTGKGRNKRYLVHWAGYSEKFDSWVSAKDLVNLR